MVGSHVILMDNNGLDVSWEEFAATVLLSVAYPLGDGCAGGSCGYFDFLVEIGKWRKERKRGVGGRVEESERERMTII